MDRLSKRNHLKAVFAKFKHYNEVGVLKVIGACSTIFFVDLCFIVLIGARANTGYSANWVTDLWNDIQFAFLALTLFSAAYAAKKALADRRKDLKAQKRMQEELDKICAVRLGGANEKNVSSRR